ncbi:MAG: TolC family protein, partial [Bdellovibrionales bacterium]
VERAKKLRDYMSGRTRMKLFDDTDLMQAQAAFETRELELQSSLDERASLIRQFNTLRGVDSDEIQNLEGLPAQALMNEVAKANAGGHMTREDFDLLRAQAKAEVAQAKYAKSQILPQLDLAASVATNGRDGTTSESYNQTETNHYPTWRVGVNFSVPLDFGMIKKLRSGYRKAGEAADSLQQQAQFSETRAWEDFNHQKKEAQGRYERSQSVEKIQTELVKRERTRLLNGRATTFEALNFEQNLALAQIQRVRAQLALMQIHNAIKTFEAR